MTKSTRFLSGGIIFLLLSFTNPAKLCRHNSSEPRFGWRASAASSKKEVAIPVHGYYTETPKVLIWDMLRDVTYEKRFNKTYQMNFPYPVFGKSVKQYAGQQMYIKGYMIPLDVDAGLYAISKYNYAACFFCGGGGPESVISLKFKGKPRRYKTDEFLTMKGTLELNEMNVDDFIYIFQKAEEYKP